MATATDVRIIGLELQQNLGTLKTNVDAIHTIVSGWTLNGEDVALPEASAVKTQLAAYNGLSVPSNTLNDSLTNINAVE